ncbi:pisatin demethylase [Lindgomyces ingoldianus]|uniref:Pisatin demethylase n=1 Tax=Lindgomyces ingoldianus TaxID=673940 RepID=A0ACB6Q8K7_9PLEO|nr:pisatin demethylase [Lindgomyces ingoldianus]KAF2463278.1 pisatin demethylase [Lindgomyces ingoldianus]
MLLNEVLPLLVRYWPLVLASLIISYLVNNKFWKGLNRYPGHWLAGYTNWWRFYDVWGRRHEWTIIRLHREHGDIVRLGPNVLSFGDPKAIKIIYGLNKGMTKSDFYPVQNAVSKGRRLQSLFSTTDENYHAKYRRCVNNAFAMSSLVNYEPLVSSTLDVFLDQTQKLYARTNKSCNFSQWLQFFAFDVIGDLTWSKRLGFVEENRDVDGMVAFLNKFLSYAGPIGQMPILDLFLEKNPIRLLAQRLGLNKTVFPVTLFAQTRSNERAGEIQKIKAYGLPDNESNPRGVDLLSKFAQAAHDHPEFMTDTQVLTSCVSMVFAGSETTGISLSSVFYFLLKHPRVYAKLMKELDDAVTDGIIESRPNKSVSWSESQKLPYLDAVIQESFRLHPAAGLILERIVPRQGMDILGNFIPGGTIVGCNAWVLHRRPEVFGGDVDAFRPERWIEASAEKLKEMKATMFQFGAGARTCIGKNVSLLEVYKLVPSFLRRFEIELERPESEWKTHNAWFVRQMEFNTKFRPREVSP